MVNPFKIIRKAASNVYVTVVSPSQHNFSDYLHPSGIANFANIIATWETVPKIFSITDFITNEIANIPVKVVKPSGREAKNSELWRLIENPNHYQSWQELIKSYMTSYEILGNSFFYGMKPEGFGDMVTSLYCLPTDKVEIILEGSKQLPAWMNRVKGYKARIGGVEYNLPATDVLHQKYVTMRYDDGSWIWGMSKYVPGDKVARELKAIHDAKCSIVESRGALGVFSNESEMPDKEQTKLVQEKLKSAFGVGEDQDKWIVTTEKLKFQSISANIQELQLIENAKYSFDDLCFMSGFDPVIFSTDGSTFANKAEARKSYVRKVLKPKVENLYQNLSVFLSAGYGSDMIVPDWSKVEELQDDREKTTKVLASQIENMIITPKEAREILYEGMETDHDNVPDTFFRRSSLVPWDQADQPTPVNPNEPNPDNPDNQNDGNNGNPGQA